MLFQDDLSKLGTEIENSLAIFCMATYGEGDPTDNAQEFFDWLKDTSDGLNGLRYTVRKQIGVAHVHIDRSLL